MLRRKGGVPREGGGGRARTSSVARTAASLTLVRAPSIPSFSFSVRARKGLPIKPTLLLPPPHVRSVVPRPRQRRTAPTWERKRLFPSAAAAAARASSSDPCHGFMRRRRRRRRAPPLRRSLRGREWRRRKRALCSPVEEPLSQDGERRASSSAHGIGPRERKREEVARERERPGGSGTERGRGSIERGGQRERKEGRWSNPEWKEEGALFAWHVASEEDQNMCSIPLY